MIDEETLNDFAKMLDQLKSLEDCDPRNALVHILFMERGSNPNSQNSEQKPKDD